LTAGEFFFKIRGYTPIPFLLVAIIFANPKLEFVVTGLIMILFGEFMRIWGVSYAGQATRTRDASGAPFLVTNGPFAFVKNPLYIGNITIYTGSMILANAWYPYLAIFVFVFFVLQYLFIIKYEELNLIDLFGNEYQKYKDEVPKFIPRLSPYNEKTHVEPMVIKAFKSEKSTFIAMGTFVLILLIRTFLVNNI